MFQSVELQKLTLATSVTKRSGEVLVRLKMARACQANVVCKLNRKKKAREGFRYVQVVGRVSILCVVN